MSSKRARFISLCTSLCAVVVLTVGLPARPAAALAEGDADGTFGVAGVTTTEIGHGSAVAKAVAIQPDGKIVTVGQASNSVILDIVLARYLKDGVPDPSFDGDGFVATDLGHNAVANAVAIQPDGKILVAGYASNGTNDDFALLRYTTTGALDPDFGIGGVATLGIGSGLDRLTSVVLQPDGMVVVAGYFFNGLVNRFGIARYTAGGGLDAGFGVNGSGIQYNTAISPDGERATGVALLSNGEIGVAGTTDGSNPDFALALYHTDGSPDTGFGGGDGFVTSDYSGAGSADFANTIAVQPDDKILLAGSVPGALAVARYTKAGVLDADFGVQGWGRVDDNSVGRTGEAANGLALQNDGRIVVVGIDFAGTRRELTVHRLNPDGSEDLDLGDQGLVAITPGDANTFGAGVAIQSDGKIVVAGSAAGNTDILVARFVGDTSAPWGAHVFGLPHYALGAYSASWLAFDSGTGVRAFDVSRHIAKSSAGTFGPWIDTRTALRRPFDTFAFGTPGTTVCLVARGIDYAGNAGPYSPQGCTAFPLDDRGLTPHGAWKKSTNNAFYRRTAMTSTTAGATLTVPAFYRRLAVVVTTCPGCGVLKIYRGLTALATINLNAAKTTRRKIIEVATSATIQHGTIVLQQASNGKPVIIDGLGVELG